MRRELDKRPLNDPPKEGESRLVITVGDRDSVLIGETRIHLEAIQTTGFGGGNRQVRLLFIAPRSQIIRRIPRPL